MCCSNHTACHHTFMMVLMSYTIMPELSILCTACFQWLTITTGFVLIRCLGITKFKQTSMNSRRTLKIYIYNYIAFETFI